ncbi:uncharacterized protein KQ657_002741 [Scheffersomyces spartinae]|uniref:Uncharacterized protein n=1 Tax=Scheffersomyces spartinae TaxID=45513 RepID=A0A9P7V605_9ASCO|nr:uncharacterized protein KQ657_002741 [Scheffersomyces spartinae]KAG7191776.1 hypothetical protein KQ657_002741 [Scheffersomyces spartinae]
MVGQFDPGMEKGFQRLSLDIPVSVDQFHKVYACIEQVFGSVDPTDILHNDHSRNDSSHNLYVPIIGSNIMFPREAWYRPEVGVKNSKVKVTLLSDIIRVVESELEDGATQSAENEVSLAYFEKLLVAFKVYDIPERSSFDSNTNNSNSFTDNSLDNISSKSSTGGSTWRSQSNGGQTNSVYSFNERDEDKLNGTIHYVLLPENHQYGRRSSVFSKEILNGKRRLLSFLLNNSSNNSSNAAHNNGVSTGPEPMEEEEDTKRQQALSNLLSKTKLYSKAKKNRDSAGSQLSGGGGGQRSNRNSFSSSTLHKVQSSQTSLILVESVSLERSSSNFNSAIPIMTPAQKLEVQKCKSEYLVETKKLVQLAGSMASSLDRANKYSRLIRFIMKFVFKFIMYDIHQMLLDYCYVKEADVVKRMC